MLLRINYSGNYAGILDASLNEGYSSASFKLVVVSAVMSWQLTLLGKVTAIYSRKAYGKPTNSYEQFVNAFVVDERHCSPSLPLQQVKKLADAAWKAADHGEVEAVVSDVLFSSANDGAWVRDENLRCSSFKNSVWYEGLVWCAYTELHTSVVKATNSSILATEKSAICVRMGEGGRGSHLCERRYV